MPGTSLFGVSNDGRVYVLSTTGSRWHELDYLGIEFKHVSAVPNCVWAVGGDRQIYLHVHGLDIPIRVKEESYENQVCIIYIHTYIIFKIKFTL
jgi:tectonin beta-propeller repeat-containing protein 1